MEKDNHINALYVGNLTMKRKNVKLMYVIFVEHIIVNVIVRQLLKKHMNKTALDVLAVITVVVNVIFH